MIPSLSTGLRAGAACLIAAAWTLGTDVPASAQQPAPPAAGAPAPEAAPTAMTTPALTGPLVANPNPMNTDTGTFGTIYFTGAISGLALFQSDPVAVNRHSHFDLSNGQFMLQKTEGLLQFYAQGGVYSLPALGTPYLHVGRTTGDFYGPFPQGFLKVAPTDEFSIQVGKLPTLIGAEYTFSFENMNIERGLLWNQENAVNRGIQANYTMGPLALSLSLNDGFYSENYNWVSGSAAWTIDKENTLSLVGMGNFGRTTKATLATPLAQNNSTIINLIYTYNAAPWTITPYVQFTNVPTNAALGLAQASTYGGAVLANYAINDNWNLAGRGEYIGTSGAGNLLYGPGSSALSFTLTPTWQRGVFFARADAAVVSAFSTAPGAAFGRTGNTKTQGRLVFETGIIF